MDYAIINVKLMVENVIQIKSRITINVDVSVKISYMKKDYIWNPATCSCANDKYLASIFDHSVITCDNITGETKTVSKTLMKKCNL